MPDEPEWMRSWGGATQAPGDRDGKPQNHLRAVKSGEPAAPLPEFPVIAFEDIEPEDYQYDIDGVFPLGEVTNLEGFAGDGKSTVLAESCAITSRGRALPGGKTPEAPSGSLIFSTEEHPAKTMLKRLRACDADPRFIRCINITALAAERGGQRFKFPSGTGRLIRSIKGVSERMGAPLTKVIFDGVRSTMDRGMDMNDERHVGEYLEALRGVAMELNIAIILIRHPSKGSTGAIALNRAGGSGAWTNVARVSWLVGREPGTQHREWRRVFVPVKENAPLRGGLFFQTEWVPEHREVKIVWGDECGLTADEIYAARDGKKVAAKATDEQVKKAVAELRQGDVRKIKSAQKAMQLLAGLDLPKEAAARAYQQLVREERERIEKERKAGQFLARRDPVEKEDDP